MSETATTNPAKPLTTERKAEIRGGIAALTRHLRRDAVYFTYMQMAAWMDSYDALEAERDAERTRADAAEAEVKRLQAVLLENGFARVAGCECHMEFGDSPCPIHDGEAIANA